MISIPDNFPQLPLDHQLSTLRELKLATLGNDQAKAALIANGTLKQLVELLASNLPVALLKEISIILSSFSYNKKNTLQLVRLQAVPVLARSCVNHFHLCKYNLKTLINVLSFNANCSLDLVSQEGRNFVKLLIHIIAKFENPVSPFLVFDACILIPYLNDKPLLVPLVKPILARLSHLLKPVFQHIAQAHSFQPSFANYDNCLHDTLLPLSPPQELVPNVVAPLLYSLAHIMPELAQFQVPKPLYFCLTLLLTNECMNLRCASLNVLTFYAKHHLTGPLKETNYKKLVPPLVNLVHQTRNLLYDKFTLSSNYRVKHEMTPLYLLSILCKEDDIIIDYLANCRVIDEVCDIITQNYNLGSKFKTEDTLNKVSDCFLVLSGICSSREHYREEFVRHDLKLVLVDILTTHLDILKELDKTCHAGTRPSNADVVFEISNNIALSACYFVRSLSRSVSLLRTYLLDLDITDVLVQLLRFPEVQTANQALQGAEVVLKSIILGILSNYVLDFSALKQDVLDHDIGSLIAHFISNSSHDLLRIYSLTLVGNYLCGVSDDEVKEEFIRLISLDQILDLCYHPNVKIQEKCFSIIRNLCASSSVHPRRLLAAFPHSAALKSHQDSDFLSFLTKKLVLADPHTEVELVSNICYTLVHLALSSERNRSLIIANTNLLHMIYSLLEDRSKGVSEVRVISPCIWILINLTWKDDTGSDNEEDDEMEGDLGGDLGGSASERAVKTMPAAERAVQLHKMGFYGILKRLSTESVMLDNRERSKTALYQMCSF